MIYNIDVIVEVSFIVVYTSYADLLEITGRSEVMKRFIVKDKKVKYVILNTINSVFTIRNPEFKK